MRNYIDSNLARDEKVIIKAQVTWWSQLWYLLFGGLFILMAIPSKNFVFFLIGFVFVGLYYCLFYVLIWFTAAKICPFS